MDFRLDIQIQSSEVDINHMTDLDLIKRYSKICTPQKIKENKIIVKLKEHVYNKSDGIRGLN